MVFHKQEQCKCELIQSPVFSASTMSLVFNAKTGLNRAICKSSFIVSASALSRCVCDKIGSINLLSTYRSYCYVHIYKYISMYIYTYNIRMIYIYIYGMYMHIYHTFIRVQRYEWRDPNCICCLLFTCRRMIPVKAHICHAAESISICSLKVQLLWMLSQGRCRPAKQARPQLDRETAGVF